MKVLLFVLNVVAVALFGMGVAKASGSMAISWCVGYFTAVIVGILDRAFWKKP